MLLAARLAIFLCLPFLFAALLYAQRATVSQPTIWASKPDVDAFEKIENDRLAAGQRAIDTLLAAKGPRTIENTLVPFDEAVRQNNSAGYFANLMEQVHPEAAFRDHATAMLTKASAAQTAISLNHDVYNALAALDLSQADAATRYYVNRQLLQFRLAGVDKDDATRARLKKLSDQATEQQSMFDRNIADGQNVSRRIPPNSTACLRTTSTATSPTPTARSTSPPTIPTLFPSSVSPRATPCAAASPSLSIPEPTPRIRKFSPAS
jgi:Zn-dependent oligopeptidase